MEDEEHLKKALEEKALPKHVIKVLPEKYPFEHVFEEEVTKDKKRLL